ncbi:MAG: response regulator [Acetobacteraceae bacterium]|nr:response regulator [Acetobacteraceae bacterium]
MERAASLTHRLLAFARRQALQPRILDPDELVAGMAELIQRTVGPQVQLQVRLGDGAWPVLCDESRLENALLNLCVNARDAMPEGGWLTITTGEAELSAADLAGEEGLSPGAYAFVAVADTGAGMDEATRARVFEPFFTTKPIGHGTGLGLSQVYGFVRQSGGLVRLDSAPGQGTTVRLLLPRHSGDGAPDSPRTAGVVLLVEDEEDLRAAAAWLREAGYRVLEAPDAAMAQRLLHGGSRVDALVTDVGLPGRTNGRQLAGVARAQRPDLPVLFMTGYAGGELRGAALPPGMAVIDKPFSLDDLAARVRAMLSAAPDPWRLVPP